MDLEGIPGLIIQWVAAVAMLVTGIGAVVGLVAVVIHFIVKYW